MSEEEKLLKEAKKLPWEDRLSHKNWKVRNEANIDLASLCDSITDPKDPRIREFGHFFKKTVADSNAPVQEKALDALIAYLRAADADAGRFGKEVCEAVVAKCLTGRPKTVEKAQAVFLLWVELEAVDAFLDAMEKAIKNKVAKAVVPAIDVMFQALSEFGAKIVPPKRLLKMLPELFDHQDQNVRASSKGLTLELCRWIGKDNVKSILFEKMRDTMKKELEAEVVNVTGTAKPSRKIRSEQDKEPEQEAISEIVGPGPSEESEQEADSAAVKYTEEMTSSLAEQELDADSADADSAFSSSFAAKLLANLQAEAAADNNKEATTIDANDADNEELAPVPVEYIEDLYEFYKRVEKEFHPHDYMDSQSEIKKRMRAEFYDWLVDVHTKNGLPQQTLYLTMNIVDRFLALAFKTKTVTKEALWLVGITSMFIASKYEGIRHLKVNSFVSLLDNSYTPKHILSMEKEILGMLEWNLTVATQFHFLVPFIKAAAIPGDGNLAYFLSELGMMHYDTLMYCPSMASASAVFAARCTLNKTPFWNETLQLYTGYSEEQLMDYARLLVSFHSIVKNGEHKAVFRKYSSANKGAVAGFPPARNLLLSTS